MDLLERTSESEPKRCRLSHDESALHVLPEHFSQFVSPPEPLPNDELVHLEPNFDSNPSNLCSSQISNQPAAESLGQSEAPCISSFGPNDPFFIELCAGSARVTTCLQFFGLKSSFGVDHKRQKNSGRLLTADLTTDEGQALCLQWLASPNCVGIFAAPPCGTCSRARGIPVRLPSGKWVPGPKPLRTDSSPDGVQHMTPTERLRVNLANSLYALITKVCLLCLGANKVVCIENPRSSLFWRTSFFAPLKHLLTYTVHQACAYGSERPKWTMLAHNTKTMHNLNNLCPGVGPHHKHKPWGLANNGTSFSTSEETAYPMKLAFHIAFFLAQHVVLQGWKPPAGELCMPDEVSYQYLRSITGAQPKSTKLPPLVSEFDTFLDLIVDRDCIPPVLPGEKLSSPWMTIPAGACLLKKPLRLTGGENFDEQSSKPNTKRLTFGIFRTCEQFICKAVEAGHPVGREARLPAALEEAVCFLESNSEQKVAEHRLGELKRWLARAKELSADEKELHASFPKSVGSILAPKRLLLWKEMLAHYGYPDCCVFDEVTTGIELSGTAPFVPCFDSCFKPAKITEDELAETAASSRKSLLASIRSSGDDFIDSEVFAKTQEEVACGWLEGPFDLQDLPPNAVISRRFGIKQGSGDKLKVRLIDDFSASGVNSTVQVDSNAKLHTLDVVAALCMELLRRAPNKKWLGKTVDLSAAYRPLAVSPRSRWVSFIAVFDPSSRTPKIYAMRALPFGASRSVYGFLRVAHSLWWLGCKALKLAWSNFFDDFVTLARVGECKSVAITIDQFFKLLGWAVSSGDKDLPFAETFKALGIEIDLTAWERNVVRFANTEQRAAELSCKITEVLHAGRLSVPDALSLRGRMQFTNAQLWGRSSKLCLNSVTNHAYAGNGQEISSDLVRYLQLFKSCLVAARPREVTPSWDSPMYLFTDASFSPECADWPCGLGGVLLNHQGTQMAAFSCKLGLDALEVLGYPEKSTVIFEAELLALLVGMAIWKKKLRNRPCVCYVDNNATRDVAIAGKARTQPGLNLVTELLRLEDEVCINAWYARVPSASNVADGPSRNDTSALTVKPAPMDLVVLMVKKLLVKVKACG